MSFPIVQLEPWDRIFADNLLVSVARVRSKGRCGEGEAFDRDSALWVPVGKYPVESGSVPPFQFYNRFRSPENHSNV